LAQALAAWFPILQIRKRTGHRASSLYGLLWSSHWPLQLLPRFFT